MRSRRPVGWREFSARLPVLFPIEVDWRRRSPLPLQQLAEQAFSGLLIAPALGEDIENKLMLVCWAPEPVLLAGDGDDDLAEVPFVAAPRGDPVDDVQFRDLVFQLTQRLSDPPLRWRRAGHRDHFGFDRPVEDRLPGRIGRTFRGQC